jgi:predicted transcriptional regulator of viral defense system
MKYQDFKNIINNPYFSTLDIHIKKLRVYNYQISYWQEQGYISRLKKGFYYFNDQVENINPKEISFFIYRPSYISLETALSNYGLIPEMVYSHTAITTKANRKINNHFGNFSYRHIHPRMFFGYKSISTKNGKYLIAEPEKALLDYFYLNLGQINDEQDIKELRFNLQEIKKIDKKKIKKYLREFNIKKLDKMINLLLKLC